MDPQQSQHPGKVSKSSQPLRGGQGGGGKDVNASGQAALANYFSAQPFNARNVSSPGLSSSRPKATTTMDSLNSDLMISLLSRKSTQRKRGIEVEVTPKHGLRDSYQPTASNTQRENSPRRRQKAGLSPMKNSLLSTAQNYQNNTVRSSVSTAGAGGGGLAGSDKRASIQKLYQQNASLSRNEDGGLARSVTSISQRVVAEGAAASSHSIRNKQFLTQQPNYFVNNNKNTMEQFNDTQKNTSHETQLGGGFISSTRAKGSDQEAAAKLQLDMRPHSKAAAPFTSTQKAAISSQYQVMLSLQQQSTTPQTTKGSAAGANLKQAYQTLLEKAGQSSKRGQSRQNAGLGGQAQSIFLQQKYSTESTASTQSIAGGEGGSNINGKSGISSTGGSVDNKKKGTPQDSKQQHSTSVQERSSSLSTNYLGNVGVKSTLAGAVGSAAGGGLPNPSYNNKFNISMPNHSNLENPLKNFETAKYASKTHGLIISYAANTHQGIQRSYNEDRVSIILNMTKPQGKKLPQGQDWPKCSYFAIYDGHGGSACADFLKECLHTIIINQDCFPQNPAQALTNGCLAAETQFLQYADTRPGTYDKSGSCAIVVMLVENACYVANVGDSRALMSAAGGQKLFVLSRDHRPNEDTEKSRITEHGGKIYQTQTIQNIGVGTETTTQHIILGPFRVLPGRLSVSRTFGDIEAKFEKYGGKPGVVIAQPEIAQFQFQSPNQESIKSSANPSHVNENQDFVIMGCDGIFDRLTNLEVQELAWKTIEECKSRFSTDAQPGLLTVHQICGRVVDALMQNAAREKSFDNLTIVMVAFKGLLDYLSKKDHLITDVSTINENSKNIKIQEGGAVANSLDSINHNQSTQSEKPLVLKKSQVKGMHNTDFPNAKKYSLPPQYEVQNTRSPNNFDTSTGFTKIFKEKKNSAAGNTLAQAALEDLRRHSPPPILGNSKTDNNSPEINFDVRQNQGGFPALANPGNNNRSSPIRPPSKGLNLVALSSSQEGGIPSSRNNNFNGSTQKFITQGQKLYQNMLSQSQVNNSVSQYDSAANYFQGRSNSQIAIEGGAATTTINLANSRNRVLNMLQSEKMEDRVKTPLATSGITMGGQNISGYQGEGSISRFRNQGTTSDQLTISKQSSRPQSNTKKKSTPNQLMTQANTMSSNEATKKLIANNAAQMIMNMNKSQSKFNTGQSGSATPVMMDKYHSTSGVNHSSTSGITGKYNFEPTAQLNPSIENFFSSVDSSDNRLESRQQKKHQLATALSLPPTSIQQAQQYQQKAMQSPFQDKQIQPLSSKKTKGLPNLGKDAITASLYSSNQITKATKKHLL